MFSLRPSLSLSLEKYRQQLVTKLSLNDKLKPGICTFPSCMVTKMISNVSDVKAAAFSAAAYHEYYC